MQNMLQKNTENDPKIDPKSCQNGLWDPMGLHSETQERIVWILGSFWGPFVAIFSHLFWCYFSAFSATPFWHSFGRIMMLFWVSFESFFSSFWGTPEKVKIWLSLQREHCFQGSRVSKNHTFLIKLWKHMFGDIFGTLFTDFGSIWGSCGSPFGTLFPSLFLGSFLYFFLRFWPPCRTAPDPLPLTLPLLGAQGAWYQLQSRLKACFPSSTR